MKSRYAGTCTRTGKTYPAGTEIRKGAKGWEIAGSIPASSQPLNRVEIRNLKNGCIMEQDLARTPLWCGACAKADATFDQGRQRDITYRPELQLRRDGDTFVCPVCGEVKAVIIGSDAEFEVYTLPRLHLTAGGNLSERLPAAEWEKIARFFEFENYRDLAERAEDEDNFDEAEEYEQLARHSRGQWVLRSAGDAARVEELLGILPENRRAVLESKEDAEEVARRAAAEQARIEREAREAAFTAGMAHFDIAQAEYLQDEAQNIAWLKDSVHIRVGEGFNIYGGGREFRVEADGQHIWLLINNGHDGDDWSRNNVGTGGAGAIGYRFETTPERLAFLRSLPGGQWLQYTKEEKRERVLIQVRDIALTGTPAPFAALFQNPIDVRSPDRPAVWAKVGEKLLGLAWDRSRVYLRAKHPECAANGDTSGLWDAFFEAGFNGSDNVSCCYLQPIIVLCYRFLPGLPWGDATFNIHLVPAVERTLPEIPEPFAERNILNVILIDAGSGIIRALRAVTFSPSFTAELHAAIRAQAAAPYDEALYQTALRRVQAQTTEQLVAAAVVRCEGGKDE